jgi:hypothetical protein
MLRRIIGLVLVLLVFNTPVFGSKAGRSFDVRAEVPFEISLSKEWTKIPDDVVEKTAKVLGVDVPRYDSAFHLASEQQWFSYPYILTQTCCVPGNGRITEKDLEGFQEGLREGFAKAEHGALSGLVSNLGSEHSRYDREHHLLFCEMSADCAGVGPVKVMDGVKFTSRGLIYVHCYSRVEHYDKYAEQFDRIIRSVSISPELEIRPTSLLDAASDKAKRIFPVALMGAVLGGAIGLLREIGRRRRQPKPTCTQADRQDGQ